MRTIYVNSQKIRRIMHLVIIVGVFVFPYFFGKIAIATNHYPCDCMKGQAPMYIIGFTWQLCFAAVGGICFAAYKYIQTGFK